MFFLAGDFGAIIVYFTRLHTIHFDNDFLDLFSIKLINVQFIRLHKTKYTDLCYYQE